MRKIEPCLSLFNSGFSCSQSVLAAYSSELGLDIPMALKVSGAFGGGIAHTGETCGAVTGALMVIGLKYGGIRTEDNEAKEKTYALAREFINRFKLRHNSTICRELLGFDLSTPEGEQAVKEHDLRTKLCSRLVQDATGIIAEML